MVNMGVGGYVGAQVWNARDICVCVADRAHCRRNPRGASRGGNYPKNWMLAVANVRGALVPNISGSMGTDCGPLRRRHSAEKAVPLPSAARRLLNLLLTEGGDTGGGVVHERDRSIKEDKKCGEPAGGP
jgi:hypothetical protein